MKTNAAPGTRQRISEQYARRNAVMDARRYSLFDAAALQAHQERLRAAVTLWREHGWQSISGLRITEVGCGSGGNLLDLLRLGATPDRLLGIDLLTERIGIARSVLPAAVALHGGDATIAPVPDGSQDAVLAFTVFSSLLDDAAQAALAEAMWRWVRPGGGVMCYDFVVDNPRNADVRGVPLARLRALFPDARRLRIRRVTLAPPLARTLARVHRVLPGALSPLLFFLRTHRLVWISRP